MLRFTLLALALVIAVPAGHVPAEAAKKSSPKQTKKTTPKSREDFTPAERAKLMEQARKLCRDKYGATSSVYRMDYSRMRVWCVPPGY